MYSKDEFTKTIIPFMGFVIRRVKYPIKGKSIYVLFKKDPDTYLDRSGVLSNNCSNGWFENVNECALSIIAYKNTPKVGIKPLYYDNHNNPTLYSKMDYKDGYIFIYKSIHGYFMTYKNGLMSKELYITDKAEVTFALSLEQLDYSLNELMEFVNRGFFPKKDSKLRDEWNISKFNTEYLTNPLTYKSDYLNNEFGVDDVKESN